MRLSGDREIRAILKRKQYTGNGPLLSFVAREGSGDSARMAVVVPGSFGNSAERNRARRLIAASFFRIYDNIGKNLDFVVFPKRSLLDHRMNVIADEMLRLVGKVFL